MKKKKKLLLLQGGLGNQLYQIAEFVESCDLERSYILPVTNLNLIGSSRDVDDSIKNAFASNFVVENKASQIGALILVLLFKAWRFVANRNIEIINIFGYEILYGYFQSPNLTKASFKQFSNLIKSKFKSEEKTDANEGVVHIRLGDYETSKKANSVHGVLDISYYVAAIRAASCYGITKFILISDSPDKLPEYRATLEMQLSDLPIKIEINHANNYRDDFVLMVSAFCIIGSNSTFSLWACYLNHCSVCIFPKNWYRIKELKAPSFPEGVILL